MKNPINLLHLKYFCDAVTHNSISEAAKLNFVSQSAVSQAISKLEICLDVPLVIHTRQKFQIAEEGKIVFEQARHIFKAVENIQECINQDKETITGSVKFASTNSLGMSFIAPSYKKMQMNFPQVDVNFKLGNLGFIRNALRQGDVEFGIVVYDQDFSQFNKRLLKKGKFNLYHNIKSPLSLIEKGILVDNFTGMHVDNLREHFLQTKRSQLQISTELAGWEVVARFTELGIGIGLFPDYITDNNRYPLLKIYPLDIPAFEYEICAIYNKDTMLSRAALSFIDQFSLGE